MTNYSDIRGYRVKYLSSDPTLNTSTEGQVWYNSTSSTLKSLVKIKAWSSGGNLNTSRHEVAGFGTQTASVAVGGYNQLFPGGSLVTNVEEYNGFAWTNGTALPVASTQYFRAGVQTAGLIGFGMRAPIPSSPASAVSFEYDGSSWTTGGTGNKARRLASGNGTQTAAIAAGGFNNPDSPQSLNNSESYDGSSWTATNTLNVTGFNSTGAGAGTQTANIIITRTPSTPTFGQVSEWDGTNWTSGTSLNTARGDVGLDGIQTNALAFGGTTPPVSNATEQWDGSTWTTTSNMGTARSGFAGSGGTNASYAGLAAGGNIGTGVTNVTEEYNSNINAITKAAWSSGGNLPSGKRVMGATNSTINASALFGGDNVPMGAGIPQLSSTEEYNGTSWTAGGPIGVNISRIAGAGTQTAALGSTGYSFPTPISTAGASYVANSWEYDGSTWTGVTAHPTTRDGAGGVGSQTAGIIMAGAAGGSPGPSASNPSVTAAEWDGSSWTVTNSINTTRRNFATGGTSPTIAWIHGGAGFPASPGNKSSIETYDGTSWTTGGSTPVGLSANSGFGTQTLAVVSSGLEGPFPAGTNTKSYQYDGTSWSATGSLATGRYAGGGDGSVGSATGFIAGGASAYSTNTTATEEFTEGSETATASTLTTS